jgi:hypothetical protein
LIAGWQQGPTGYDQKERPYLLKEINRRVAGSAQRFVFYSKQENWVAELAGKVPYLSNIQ